jgi:aryl-phospho-beta-D-glucosidase BglC (GH1 family)
MLSLVLLAGCLLPPEAPLEHGRLSVSGSQLVGEAGEPVQLRGVSFHGMQWFPDCLSRSSVEVISADWGASVVRIASYVEEGGYLTDPVGTLETIEAALDWTEEAGIYAIVDWHVLSDGDPMKNVDDAEAFWSEVSAMGAGRPHVLYEIANEPNGVEWPRIAEYASRVIPVIRSQDDEAVILVGTPQWSQDLTGPLEQPLADKLGDNVMYTLHFYAASHTDRSMIEAAAGRLPVFVSEFGISEYTGDGKLDTESADAWLASLEADDLISWVGWSFSDKAEGSAALAPGSCAAGDWDRTSKAGDWLRRQL